MRAIVALLAVLIASSAHAAGFGGGTGFAFGVDTDPEYVLIVGDTQIGGGRFTVIAGPCAVEDAAQMTATAMAVKAAGAHGRIIGHRIVGRVEQAGERQIVRAGDGALRADGCRGRLRVVAGVRRSEAPTGDRFDGGRRGVRLVDAVAGAGTGGENGADDHHPGRPPHRTTLRAVDPRTGVITRLCSDLDSGPHGSGPLQREGTNMQPIQRALVAACAIAATSTVAAPVQAGDISPTGSFDAVVVVEGVGSADVLDGLTLELFVDGGSGPGAEILATPAASCTIGP